MSAKHSMTRQCLIDEGMLVPDQPTTGPVIGPVLKLDDAAKRAAARAIAKWESRGRPTHEAFLDTATEAKLAAKEKAKRR